VHQPGELHKILAAAGRKGPVHVVYQPKDGDPVEHFEHVAWMCIRAGHIVFMCDEVDMICSAGSAKNKESDYWRQYHRPPALSHIVNFGRHSPMAFVGISRAPQDVWRRLRGQAGRMLVFTMDDDLELEALRSRLGRDADQLPHLERYTYLDWYDGEGATVEGGKL